MKMKTFDLDCDLLSDAEERELWLDLFAALDAAKKMERESFRRGGEYLDLDTCLDITTKDL